MSDGSDIEIKKTLPKKQAKKMLKVPSEDIVKGNEEAKKPSTKVMVHQALKDLKSRKGTSLYAIKKYIEEKFNVDIKKINNIIKKVIKVEVEAGTIVQTKGVGASGSFKLVVGKEKVEKKKEAAMKLVKKVDESEDKPKKIKDTQEKAKGKSLEKKVKKKVSEPMKKTSSKSKTTEKAGKEKIKEVMKEKNKSKALKPKSAKAMQTPVKKKADMLKRKSIGSIIKPPKMRPKAKD